MKTYEKVPTQLPHLKIDPKYEKKKILQIRNISVECKVLAFFGREFFLNKKIGFHLHLYPTECVFFYICKTFFQTNVTFIKR